VRLQDKVAVVTGGGGGIGAAICRAFAAEGARVAVTDLRKETAGQVAAEIRAAAGQAEAWPLDVAERVTVERAADEIAARLGPVDIWVNNAGISRVAPFMECTDDLWDTILRINMKGTFIGCQAALRQMLPRQRGVILNMSSQSGKGRQQPIRRLLRQQIRDHRADAIAGAGVRQRRHPRQRVVPGGRLDGAVE